MDANVGHACNLSTHEGQHGLPKDNLTQKPELSSQHSACLTALLGTHFPRLVAWLL